MTNTRKHSSSIRRYMFTVTAVAFALTIVAVNASFAQSPSENPQSSAKQKPFRATSNVMLDPAKAPPAPPALLIDSFRAGAYSMPPLTTTAAKIKNPDEQMDLAGVIGGKRQFYLQITNPDKQPVSFQILTSKPALIFSAGYNVYPGLELNYTKIPQASADLISKYDRFLIDFDGLDHSMQFTITVYGVPTKNGDHSSIGCQILPPPEGPFTVSFPFARIPSPEFLKTTTEIHFGFGQVSRGLDYAITRITAAKGDPVGKHIVTCSK
jgi:hypothetical protein